MGSCSPHMWQVVAACVWLVACNAYDAGALRRSPPSDGGNTEASAAVGDRAYLRDAAVPGDAAAATGNATPDRRVGFGAAASSGVDATASPCVPNPDKENASCPTICPEVCNGEDDDCDGMVDEELDASCVLEHAVAACSRGGCLIVECEDGYRDCDHDPATGCEVRPDDPDNCGTCGNHCALPHAISACVDGQCVPTGCQDSFADCDDNPNDCETSTTSLDNCAGCGLHCSDADVANGTASCELGSCGVGTCFTDYGDCNRTPDDGCEQSLMTVDDCGACGQACDFAGSVDDCSSGVCLAQSCEPGYDDCDGDPSNGCESLDHSPSCGACGHVCDDTLPNVASASCEGGQCDATCASGFADCDHDVETGCETSTRTNSHCGGCDTACSRPNAVMSCASGRCEFVRCRPGYGDCNGDLESDGCETRLNSDTHCGGCGNDCTATSAPVCSGGRCSAVVCPDPNTADCNQDGLPCEVDLLTDPNHCGSCDLSCELSTSTPHASPTLACSDGHCEAQCDSGWADCNGDYRDGCETSLTTLSDCGQCGMGCAIANATPTCASGSCRVDHCAPDRADCDHDGTSCETQLGTASNCTACGQPCMLPNAVPSCTGSAGNHQCAIGSCSQSYYKDCDGSAANGCEVDVRSNPASCGQCGRDCTTDPHVAGATCGSGVCGYSCDDGYGDCNSTAGCETPLDTKTNCHGCGVSCARANGSADCSSGTCTLTGCNQGFKDCDGDSSDGCEPLTSLVDCGDCGVPCTVTNGTPSCSSGTCAVDSCDSGWDDCDGDVANGCERNVSPPANGGLGPCLPDPSCTRESYGGHEYFFCTATRSWSDAQAHCRQQLLGDLVDIGDSGENAFVQSHLSADAWLGGSDSAAAGTWRWADDSTQFWANAMATGYANWAAGEPGGAGGNAHCAAISGGAWDARACTDALAFVCEVRPDGCPDDPDKTAPGVCGCGVADTDTDGDGTANCMDGCPNDMAKTDPGLCGCGVADSTTDSDSDGTPDCNDKCPTDPDKTAPGACGCNAPDTLPDGGTAC